MSLAIQFRCQNSHLKQDNFIEVTFEYCADDKKVSIIGFTINNKEGICEF